MIDKFVFGLYRKYCSEHYNKCIQQEIELERLKRDISISVKKDEYVKVFDSIKRDNAAVVGIERNRNGEYVIVCRSDVKDSIRICLYSPSYNEVSRHPKIIASLATDKATSEQYMHIDDILMVDNNIGNGSICMRYFIAETKKHGIADIRGILSPVDAGHFDRSIHFYRKHGFKVELSDDRQSGRIRYSETA